jgi:energy-coupling factor transport system ATP-binding protein
MRIQTERLSFTYPSGVQALVDISLAVEAGENLAVIGENGAGKTTLARHLIGLLKPSAGRVRVGDWDTRDHSAAQLAKRVGYAFQNPDNQIFASSLLEEVAFGPRNLGQSEAEAKATAKAALEATGLTTLEQHPYDLHMADRKLLTIASVLAMKTPVVILDEPTTGQDASHQAQIGAIVADLITKGRTVIAISHDLEFVVRHFERVVVMADGGILADGAAAEILSQAELLQRAAVEAPQLARLAQALGLEGLPRTAEEFWGLYQASRR